MQTSLFKQKLKRRGVKVTSPKALGIKLNPYNIILGFIKTEKTDNQFKIETKVKVPVLDSNGNKKKVDTVWTSKAGKEFTKQKVQTTEKVIIKNKLTFKVANGVNKIDVKEAIQSLYGVEVEKVNMIKSPYKKRQRRGLVRKAYVKAVVTLKEGQKVPQLDKVK